MGRVSGLLSRWRAGCANGIVQRVRHLVADRAMGASLTIAYASICEHMRRAAILSHASASVGNQCAFRHSARKRPLNASMNALSSRNCKAFAMGLSGRETSSVPLSASARRSRRGR